MKEGGEFHLEIADLQDRPVPGKEWFLRLLEAAAGEEGKVPRISLALVDDGKIAELHEAYLGDGSATDVMSFPLDEEEGEVILSVETAEREAERLGVKMEEELALYFVHGLLHLLGYDDRDEQDRRKMIAAEKRVLARVGIEPASRG